MKKVHFIFLFLIFLAGYLVRVIFLPKGALSFAYDQARDAFIVQEILSGDLKILGPSVSGIPGLYHGVLYYYVLTLGYILGKGNPVGAAVFLSFLSSGVTFIVFYFTYKLTKRVLPAFLSALFFAFSFEASQYAGLLTNASMAVWFVPLTYLGLFLWVTKSWKWAPLLTGIGLGFSIQSEIALGYHVIPVVFWLVFFREKINKRGISEFLISFLLAISTMILAEFRFGFKGLSGLYYLFSVKDEIAGSLRFGDFIITYLNQVGSTFSNTLFPLNAAFGGLMGVFMVIYSFKRSASNVIKNVFPWQAFLASSFLSYIIVLPFGGSNMRHIMVGAAPEIAVMAGIFIWLNLRKNKIILIAVTLMILTANLIKIFKENRNGETIFPLQQDLVLSNELEAVNYTYISSGGEKFSINSLTSPLYVNTLWSFLYNWYGKSKYGFLPFWTGRDQIGQLGNNLPGVNGNINLHYYIVEPTYGIPEQYVAYSQGEEDSNSVLIDERKFGSLIVQKRLVKR